MLQSKALNGEVARNDGFQRRHQAYKRLLSQCSHSHAYGIGVDTYSDPIHTYRNAISTLPLGLESRYKDLRSFLSFFFTRPQTDHQDLSSRSRFSCHSCVPGSLHPSQWSKALLPIVHLTKVRTKPVVSTLRSSYLILFKNLAKSGAWVFAFESPYFRMMKRQ